MYLRNRWYDPQSGRFLTQDPIGMNGGVNLYAYAGNNPSSFSDPFGLCAEGGDSTKVTVTVDCGDGTRSTKEVWVQQISDADAAAVVKSAGRLTGGTKDITPAMVQRSYGTLADTKSLYVLPTTVDGHPVLEGATTRTGGGQPVVTAFRPDALKAIVSGDLGAKIGNRGFNAATVLGHEGAHYWGSVHPATYAIPWGFTP